MIGYALSFYHFRGFRESVCTDFFFWGGGGGGNCWQTKTRAPHIKIKVVWQGCTLEPQNFYRNNFEWRHVFGGLAASVSSIICWGTETHAHKQCFLFCGFLCRWMCPHKNDWHCPFHAGFALVSNPCAWSDAEGQKTSASNHAKGLPCGDSHCWWHMPANKQYQYGCGT